MANGVSGQGQMRQKPVAMNNAGAGAAPAAGMSMNQEQPKSSKKWLWWVLGACGLILVIALVWWMLA